jgi:hypothetical protein
MPQFGYYNPKRELKAQLCFLGSKGVYRKKMRVHQFTLLHTDVEQVLTIVNWLDRSTTFNSGNQANTIILVPSFVVAFIIIGTPTETVGETVLT